MNPINKDVLDRFFRKQCTEEETEVVMKWLTDPKNADQVDELMETKWERGSYDPGAEKAGEVHERINKIITAKNNDSSRKYWVYSAAAIVLIAVFGLLFLEGSPWANADDGFITKMTASGDKLTTQLPDGSIVTLNSESEIRYSASYGVTDRQIFLKGEALFEVAKDTERPFIVNCGEVDVTALGTVFNINAFDPEDKTEVSLLRGKVNVKAEKAELILNKGESATFVNSTDTLMKRVGENSSSALWAEGIIHFNKTAIDEALIVLERWYDVDIELVNKPNPAPVVSGSFKDANLESVLKSIGFALEFEFKRTNKKVNIEFKK
ncbi:FecR domain-containing protein [Fulvivirga maritima]|uniref:FecR family protein n=1 Tax=Fulvivirga maritima TaxID=2904247 RepID=UPI001F46BC8F|nr:FecR domain-containing protein [Fulvivirga maritima]UII27684.1 FecR domain-containing protein [Fulvivirga maritima]